MVQSGISLILKGRRNLSAVICRRLVEVKNDFENHFERLCHKFKILGRVLYISRIFYLPDPDFGFTKIHTPPSIIVTLSNISFHSFSGVAHLHQRCQARKCDNYDQLLQI